MQLKDGYVSAIGNTPLVRLNRLPNRTDLQVYAKLEFLNPTGSAKDRPAFAMIRKGLESGLIHEKTVIIESSSGNMAISLASICKYLSIRFICVVDAKTSQQNIAILRALGAEVDIVLSTDPETNEFLPARLKRVQQLIDTIEHSIWLNQYENVENMRAHQTTTIAEIQNQLGNIDYLFCGMSTCGTISGCASAFANVQDCHLVGVDVLGSKIAGDTVGRRLFPGLGAGITPPFYDETRLHQVVHVSDWDCVVGCRRVAASEGLLVGASSGGIASAFADLEHQLPAHSVCVLIFHDRGERYLQTVFDDQWVREQFAEKEGF